MRARIIILLLIFCLFVCGCQQVVTDNTTINTTVTTTTQSIGDISLGITPKQFLEVLSKAEIQIAIPDYAELPLPDDVPDAAKDGRAYNMTDYSFYYKAKDYSLTFTFSYEGSLINIYCADARIPSHKGLVIGDSVKKAEQLYGADYTHNPEDVLVMQYKVDKGYFNVFYSDGVVTGWSLSAYSDINND